MTQPLTNHRSIAAGLACLAVLWAPGCGGAPAARQRTSPAAGDEPLDLAALARSIDPGAIRPLSTGAPKVIADAFASADASSFTAEQLAAKAEEMTRTLGQSSQLDLASVLTLVYLADQIERRLDGCDLACLAAAERVFSSLDVPWLAESDAFIGQLLGLGALMQRDMPAEQAKEVFAFLRGVFGRASLRHRWIAARILRSAPDSEAATAALRSLASSAERANRYPEAVRLRRTVAARGQPGFDDLAALAGACALAEQVACAEEAIGRARATSGEHPDRIAELRRQLDQTRRIRALAGARGFDAELERAGLLVDVGRQRDAVAALEPLAAAHPRDARPLVALAAAWFSRGKADKAGELVARARPLEHKDERFYELAIGLAFQHVMQLIPGAKENSDAVEQALVGYLPQLRADVDGLTRFRPGLGGVLTIVVGRLQEGAALMAMTDPAERRKRVIALSAAALADALALERRARGEPDVYRVIFLAGRFASRPGDHRATSIEVPPGLAARDELLLMKAGLLYSQAVSWRDPTRLPDLERAMKALSSAAAGGDGAKLLRADTMAFQARLAGRPELWREVAGAYQALVETAAPADRPRLQNNLAVALWEAGDRAGARAAWDGAAQAEEPHMVVALNRAVTADAFDPAALDGIADKSDKTGVQVQALRWKIALGRLRGKARRAAEERARTLLAENTVDNLADGATGVVLEESFNVGVGYSTRDRLVVQLALGRAAFLILPAPAPVKGASRARR